MVRTTRESGFGPQGRRHFGEATRATRDDGTTLHLDVFNALNAAVVLREFREAASPTFRRPQELVAPRLLRLAMQLRF